MRIFVTATLSFCLLAYWVGNAAQASSIRRFHMKEPSLMTDPAQKDDLAITLFYAQMQLEQEAIIRLLPAPIHSSRKDLTPETESAFPQLPVLGPDP